jgi:hypothetical protein
MAFKLELTSDVDRRLRRAFSEVPRNASCLQFWKDLGTLLDWLTENASEVGEVCYTFKNSPFESRLAGKAGFSVQFAVSAEKSLVFVQKISLSGNHPYPPELDGILHDG